MVRLQVGALCVVVLLAGACSADDEPVAAPSSAAVASPSATTAAPTPSPSPSPVPTAPPGPVTAQEPPPSPADPAGLAAQVVQAERTIRSGTASADDLAQAGRLQQAAYRELAARPQWQPAVLDAVPADLHGSVVAHTDAIRDLLKLTRAQPRLPSWRIVAPPPPEQLLAHYREAEQVFGVEWEYLASIHLVESRMGRIRGTSPAGAQGPMQFMPGTWEIYGEGGDIQDPRDAVLAAGRYLQASGAPGNMRKALFAYNRSDAYVRAITVHAEQMQADPRTYDGYWHWQVYYRTVEGDRLLPVGYDGTA